MIKIGTEVKCDPLKNLRLYSTACFGIFDETKIKYGVVIYINRLHRWFLIECDIGNGHKVRRGYNFDCIGKDVQLIRKEKL